MDKMTAMANMQLDELVRLIDPTLAVKRQLEPSSLNVCEVEKRGNRYVLKVSELCALNNWKAFELNAEREILRIAHGVQGITHLIHDYGDVKGYSAILKEYFEGKNPLEISIAGEPFMQSAGNKLKETLGRLHSLGFAGLDIKPYNVIISPDGRDARIIDLGMYITAGEVEPEQFQQRVISDNSCLQNTLSYFNTK